MFASNLRGSVWLERWRLALYWLVTLWVCITGQAAHDPFCLFHCFVVRKQVKKSCWKSFLLHVLWMTPVFIAVGELWSNPPKDVMLAARSHCGTQLWVVLVTLWDLPSSTQSAGGELTMQLNRKEKLILQVGKYGQAKHCLEECSNKAWQEKPIGNPKLLLVYKWWGIISSYTVYIFLCNTQNWGDKRIIHKTMHLLTTEVT